MSAILAATDERLDRAAAGPLKPLFDRAGVAAGSFYEYFATRDDLLGAVIERVTQRNFDSFLEDVERAVASGAGLERVVRGCAERIALSYLTRPTHLRTVIRLAEQLGLLPYVSRERDRFADAVATTLEPLLSELAPDQGKALMRAVADGVMGVVVVSLYRSPLPDPVETAALASDVAWGVARSHLERAE